MSRISKLMLLSLALLWWLSTSNLHRALPPDLVVIQAGPVGGTFDGHARRYAELMRGHGFRVEVRNQDETLRIIDRVNDATAGVQIGFTAQRVHAVRHPHVLSAGAVELRPLFLFLHRGVETPATLADLAGRRLVMPPDGSITAQAARDLLARYGISAANATWTFMPIGDAAEALQRGEHDAGFFMLDPGNPMVRRLAADPGLIPLSLVDTPGIARQLDYLMPATLVRGAIELQPPQPAHDIALIGAAVNVIVRSDIHPAVLYALLQAMDTVHEPQTLISEAGAFPRQTNTALTVHPLAQAWRRNGTPWLYAHLPGSAAGWIEAYWGTVLGLATLASALAGLRSLGVFIDSMTLAALLHGLAWVQRRVHRRGAPGRLGRLVFRVAEPILQQRGKSQVALERLEQLRPHIVAPPAS